jgi:hypothetical protein
MILYVSPQTKTHSPPHDPTDLQKSIEEDFSALWVSSEGKSQAPLATPMASTEGKTQPPPAATTIATALPKVVLPSPTRTHADMNRLVDKLVVSPNFQRGESTPKARPHPKDKNKVGLASSNPFAPVDRPCTLSPDCPDCQKKLTGLNRCTSCHPPTTISNQNIHNTSNPLTDTQQLAPIFSPRNKKAAPTGGSHL